MLSDPVNFVDPEGLEKGDWWDPRTYIGVSYSTIFLLKGETIANGIEQPTVSSELIGASFDIYIGIQPCKDDNVSEISIGPLGKQAVSIGYYFGEPNSLGHFKVGGLALHFGLGIGSPIGISSTFPPGTDIKY